MFPKFKKDLRKKISQFHIQTGGKEITEKLSNTFFYSQNIVILYIFIFFL